MLSEHYNWRRGWDTPQHTKKECSHCGWRNHASSECRFKESSCYSCGKIGHLATICRKQRSVNYVSESDLSDNSLNKDFNNFSVYCISSGDSTNVYFASVNMDGIPMNAVCDTGSPCSLIPASIFKNLKTNVKCKPCNTSYVDYGGNKIELIGEFNSVIEYRNLCKTIKVVVTNINNPPWLGRNFLRAFNFGLQQVNSVEISKSNELLLLTEQVKNEFSEIFNGELGAYRLEKISLPIDKNAKPVFFKPRPVPFAWKEAIEKDLQDLIENDVLEPVETSDWGTPLVPILKPNGKLRICGDYEVTVNQFLSDFKYPLPLIDEIFAALQGGELFTKLDMSNAYNQLILDEQSQLLCVWSTHIGTLKMKRLPFGVKPAAAIFQKVMETLLRDIPFVVVYQDDITVSGRNLAEHLKNLKAVLGKLQQAGLKLNKSKCSF